MWIRKYDGKGNLLSETEIPDPPATADDVRAEASRRMQTAFHARNADHLDIIIANAIREVARLNQIKLGIPNPDGTWLEEPREWTTEEKLRLMQLHKSDTLLEALRTASNILEPNPPVDFTDDKYWPKT